MRKQKHYRIATPEPLAAGKEMLLSGNVAHYLSHVLRLKPGDQFNLFNATDGEFSAKIHHAGKRDLTVTIGAQERAQEAGTGLTVCFAPVKGSHLENIIEKATELGADILQPILTQRSVVDKVNLERVNAIAREAAEQCERISWPMIHAPVKLLNLLGDWPKDMPLIYGDESGESASVVTALAGAKPAKWGILTGPEGGFTPEEFAALKQVKSARGVGLGPRILRADTAVITLCTATLMAWGDWDRKPRFSGE